LRIRLAARCQPSAFSAQHRCYIYNFSAKRGEVTDKEAILFVGESTYPGRIFKVSLEGKVLGVIGSSGRQLKQFSGAHALACPSDKEIYAAETSNWRVQKLILK